MGANPKRFRNMTTTHRADYRRNVMRLHRGLALAHLVGMSGVCLFGIGLLAYHLITK